MDKPKNLKILLIENDPEYTDFISEILGDEHLFDVSIKHADSLAYARMLVEENIFDIILLDLNIIDSCGINTFYEIKNLIDTPVLILSEIQEQCLAIEAIKHGAQDYMVKSSLENQNISRAILYAIDRHQVLSAVIPEEVFWAGNPYMMFVIDHEKRIKNYNSKVKQIFSDIDIHGKTLCELISCVNSSQLRTECFAECNIHSMIEKAVSENRVILKGQANVTGLHLHHRYELSVEPVIYDKEQHILLIIENVMKKNEIEKALFSAEHDLIEIIRLSPNGIIITDESQKILFFNETAALFLGNNIQTGDSFEHAAENTEIILGENTRQALYYVINTARVNWCRKPAILHMLTDITALRKMEEEKKNLEKEYIQSQKMEILGKLTGGIAHDLNNLLMPIIYYLEKTLNLFSPDTEHYRNIQNSMRAVNAIKELTHQLRLFCYNESEKIESIEINSVLTEFQSILKRTIGENIRIEYDLWHENLNIEGNATQIKQIIMNIVINARDAMQNGGLITIKTEKAEIIGDAEGIPDGTYTTIEVTDDGFGMTPEVQEHIFEPFFTTKNKENGTGFGLAIVKRIIQNHNGYITVQSSPGKGTRFLFYFPYAGICDIEEENKESVFLEGHGNIIIVEDDEQILFIMSEILKSIGYSVFCFSDSVQALNHIQSLSINPDLLITDVMMPQISGTEIAKEFRKHFTKPVLFVSGYSGSFQNLVENDQEHFIAKPFGIFEFSKKIKSIIKGSV